jgi:5'(3')-deoxyribonucleotidase
MKPQLFLDCDGVLADFDSYFESIAGMTGDEFELEHGTSGFWTFIQAHRDFFYNLPLMEDAQELYDAVAHLRPIILTGVPFGNWAVTQKLRWRDKYFPGVPMVTCTSRHKKDYCKTGDVLIDDLHKYKHLWESAGGTFILHTSASDSVAQLKQVGGFL